MSVAVFEGTVRTVETLRFLFSLIDDSHAKQPSALARPKLTARRFGHNLEVLPPGFSRPRKAWYLCFRYRSKFFFEIPGCADTIRGKDQVLKLARSGVIEAGKIIGGDFKMISQCMANRVHQ